MYRSEAGLQSKNHKTVIQLQRNQIQSGYRSTVKNNMRITRQTLSQSAMKTIRPHLQGDSAQILLSWLRFHAVL